MLESPAMDKKNSARSSSSAPKGNTNSDAKSKQDGSGNKQQQQQWPGGGGGASGGGGRRGKWSGQQGEGRRPTPQRNRTTPDKRPQAKGQPPSAAQSARQNSQGQRSQVARSLQDDCVEEALRKGNRKVNLNHLLNFTLTPRESDYHHHHHHYWPGPRSIRPPPAKHSKEQFLQANCQFVVREGTMCRWNPDVPVAWELVHEVRVLQQQSTTGQEERCPVCLGTPRAAQTPPCGHVYCWSCLLHYLALSDRPYRPCPICDRPFSAQQLRRVVPQPRRGYQPGDEITMCLMRRQKNQPGAQPMPADLWRVDDLEPFNINREERLTCHQRVLVACPKQLGAMLDREESELRSQLLEEGDAPEACFVQAALQALQQRREDLEKEVGPLDVNANSQGHQLTVDAEGNIEVPACGDQLQVVNDTNDDNGDLVPYMMNSPHSVTDSHQMRGRERCISSGSSGAEDSIVGAEDLEMPVCTATNAGSNNNGCREGIPGGDSFYYFQAADGQPVFLHALNARMLVHEYGALELAPVKFTARIVEIEGASIDNELRRRLRYLRHLPLTCEIQVVEVQLEPPVIKQATMEHFAADVEKRRRQRSRRARNEKRQDRLRAKEEMRRQGYGGSARYQLNSARHFPTCEPISGATPAAPASSPPRHSSSTGSESSLFTVSDLDERQQVTPSSAGVLAEEAVSPTPAGSSANRVSFAQMVQTRSAGAAGGFCRRLPATGSSAPKTVAAAGSDADDDEEYCPVPQYRQSFSQALEEALNAAAAASAAAHADSAHLPDGQKDKPGSKKKKKKNVTLLFATSMNRSK